MSFWKSPPQSDPSLGPALADLARLVDSVPEFQAVGRLVAALLGAAFGERLETPPRWERPEATEDRPLFVAAPPRFDVGRVRRRFLKLVRAMEPFQSNVIVSARRAPVDSWMSTILAGRALEAPPPAEALTRLALLPELAALTNETSPFSPNCGFCGRPPIFAESRGLEQSRFLRCGLCASESKSARLGCPLCGEEDHRRVSILTVADERERRRLIRCEGCGGRLKLLNTLGRISPPGLLVAELELSPLDHLSEGS